MLYACAQLLNFKLARVLIIVKLVFTVSISCIIQVVMSCVEGSPADRAGIYEGDELMEINGKSMSNS